MQSEPNSEQIFSRLQPNIKQIQLVSNVKILDLPYMCRHCFSSLISHPQLHCSSFWADRATIEKSDPKGQTPVPIGQAPRQTTTTAYTNYTAYTVSSLLTYCTKITLTEYLGPLIYMAKKKKTM